MTVVDNCVFCDRTKFEERIVGENADFFIVATIGQISNGGYLLLIPKRHLECLGAMTSGEIVSAYQAIADISKTISKEYSDKITVFEHGIVGQTIRHAHLHFIPEECDITQRVEADFPDFPISEPTTLAELTYLYSLNSQPYLFWKDKSLETHICWDPPAPDMYLRIVVAEALGRPERANWRTMDREMDNRLVRETVARLKPHFS